MEFRVLGPLEAIGDDGQAVRLGGQRERALLALLLARPNQAVSVDAIVDGLWGDQPPRSAEKTLQSYVVRLRRTLEPARPRGAPGEVLVTREPGYLLRIAPQALDATRFEQLVRQGRGQLTAGDPQAGAATLRQALALWRGPAFQEFEHTSFGQAEAERLKEVRLGAIEDRVHAELAAGKDRELVAELEGLVREQPLRERLWAALLLALYRAGRQAAALRAYQRARAMLVEELGIEPGTELRRLQAAILAQDPALDAVRTTPQVRPVPGQAGPLEPVGPPYLGTVTLLFTDIEGSTQLLRQLRGRYAEVLTEHQRLLRAAFKQAGGQEIDTQGDSFFFAFRTARDAVAGTVAAQRALARHGWPDGIRVSVRMGLHTAEPEPGAERYVGLGIHRAARICSAAHGGQILLSEATRALVEGELPARVRLRNLGKHRLKGFDHAELIYQLTVDGLPDQFPPLRTAGSAPHAGRHDEPSEVRELDDAGASNFAWIGATAGLFVGRAQELQAIQRAWSHANSGARVLVLLGGEPGIGKTALAAEAARRLHGSSALVLHGRWDEELLAPYQAFREALGEYARACPRAILRADLRGRAGEISRLLPEVAEHVGTVEAPLAGAAEAERFRLFEALDGWTAAMASRRPVLMVLDDLHWADRPSLLLVQHLMRSTRATRLLVLATYRDTGLDQSGLAGTLSALARDTDCRRVAVRGLSGLDILEMLRQLAGRKLGGSDLVLAEQLERETEGNAFFVREILRHLVEADALPSGRGEGHARAPALEVPETIRDMVRWRLGRLSRQCTDALAVACVIGQEFHVDVLRSASGIDDDRLVDLLEEAAAAGLINETPEEEPSYVFSHAVVRRVLFDDLSGVRRTRLHRRVAETLEAYPGAATTLAKLAYHYCASAGIGSADKAVRYARLAGDRALDEAAHEAAVQHYQEALKVLDRFAPDDRPMRGELLLTLGGAHDAAAEYGARDQRFLEAAQVARELDRVDLLTRAAVGYGGVLPAAVRPDPQAQTLLEEALGRLGDEESAARALLLGRLAHWLHYQRPYLVRMALCDESVAMARRVGDLGTLAATLVHRCWALDGPDDVEDRLTIAAEVMQLGEDLGDQEVVLQGLRIRLLALFERGHIESARHTSRALAGLAERLRHPEYLRLAKMWDVLVAAIEGRHQDAERFAEELHSWLEQISHPQSALIFIGQTFSWRWLQGRSAEYLPIFEAMATSDPTTLVWSAVLAWCCAELGAFDRVREILRTVTSPGAAGMDKNYLWWGAVVGFTNAAARIGDREWASVLYRLALPFADHNCTLGLTSFQGAVAHHLGVLAGVLGQWDDAVAHFEAALQRHQTMRARPFIALTQQAYADVLVARDGPRDHARARQLQEAALRTAEELGLRAIQARTRLGS